MAAFKEQHARKPMLADVHATREPWSSHHAFMQYVQRQQPDSARCPAPMQGMLSGVMLTILSLRV